MRRACLVLSALLVALGLASCAPVAHASHAAPATLLGLVNAERAAAGMPPLQACAALDRAAEAHTADMAAHRRMSHTGSDGSSFVDRANRAGYRGWNALGENVAAGYSSVWTVIDAWMRSPGHRANILSRSYTHFGRGYVVAGNGTAYWTQDFGRGGTC
jgi:uncharacterized protein YkwD